ncbi:MAG: hypothetical protein WDL99_03735 [Candidatus Omnitrophota bacterium]|jgi:hypothetical protein
MKNSKECPICRGSTHFLANYCKRCKKLIDRVDMRAKINKEARIQALKRAWDGNSFRCYYTGIKLVENNHKDPLYLTFDHRIPRKEDDIVVAAAILNDMKSDMDENEFKAIIFQLAEHFKGKEIDEKAFEIKFWKR